MCLSTPSEVSKYRAQPSTGHLGIGIASVGSDDVDGSTIDTQRLVSEGSRRSEEPTVVAATDGLSWGHYRPLRVISSTVS